MKRFISLILLLVPAALSAQIFGLDPVPTSLPASHLCIYKDTLVAGGDGHLLVTQMYMPEGDGPWPVVVYRTPYMNNAPLGDWMLGFKQYAERGIGVIVQRCRGTGGSEGTFEPNVNERADGLALLDWLQKAPWCKSIGLTGCSYMGLTSWIVADAVPEKVKGIYLEHYGVDRHLSAYNSGLFRQDILTAWAIDNAGVPIRKPEVTDSDKPYYDEMRYMPQRTMDEDLLGAQIPWYRDWISHTDYPDPYWHTGFWALLRSIPPKIQVPMTVVAGHFDHHMEGTILGYELLPEATKARSRLLVGGWNHGFETTPKLDGLVHDHDIDINLDTFEWFYSLLVEEKEPVHEVKVYDIGADKWLSLPEWPSAAGNARTFFLSSEAEGTVFGLKDLPSGKRKALSYDYDPSDPVFSIGGETLFNSNTRKGSQPQKPAGYRDDILFFRSEPLTNPMTLSGMPKAVIWFSSDCEDTAVTVKISEEKADGTTLNIRTGIATLAFRKAKLGHRGTYTPGEIVPVEIQMLPIVWELQPGSRIRVDISSSDFPQYSIHSNYPGVWSAQTAIRTARQHVWTGKPYPSRIELPLLP